MCDLHDDYLRVFSRGGFKILGLETDSKLTSDLASSLEQRGLEGGREDSGQFLEFYRSNEASLRFKVGSCSIVLGADSLVTWEESSGSHGESCSTFELIRDNSDSGRSRWRQRATPPFTRRSCSIVSVSTATWIFLHSSELPRKRIHQPPPPLREDSFGNVSRAVPIAKASAAERQRRKWGGAGERWLAKRRKKEEAKEAKEEEEEEEEEGESRLSKRGQKDSSEIKNSQGVRVAIL
ncbi:hypothetical protein K0M31_003285 [Melipona bicolor]|uniref:Uncharacterized protein n=1 Tax=Melipona bicolor TaxID=60889 RepID=A0AA40FYY3_9HYME|nr:hypothetical protein K0M31_003285 [Melipona bicolor]